VLFENDEARFTIVPVAQASVDKWGWQNNVPFACTISNDGGQFDHNKELLDPDWWWYRWTTPSRWNSSWKESPRIAAEYAWGHLCNKGPRDVYFSMRWRPVSGSGLWTWTYITQPNRRSSIIVWDADKSDPWYFYSRITPFPFFGGQETFHGMMWLEDIN
jgi:hypothetical protein